MSVVVHQSVSSSIGKLEERERLLRRGVFLLPFHDAAIWKVLDWFVPLGLWCVVLHPTVASLYGQQVSKIFAMVAIVLLLPACRRIVIAPFVAIIVASLALGAYMKSPGAIISALAVYAIFYLLVYETRRFMRIILTICAVAAVVALLQFLIPSPYLNFHATAESLDRFLDQYRPTSIFPTQAYYNQLLLLLIPIFAIANERRFLVLALTGFSALVTGATAGLVFVVVALFLGLRQTARYVFVGAAAALCMMAIGYPERLAYNFSLHDQIDSIGSRIKGASLEPVDSAALQVDPSGVTTETKTTKVTKEGIETTKIITVAAPKGHPTLLSAVQVLAIAGLLLASMMAVKMAMPFSILLSTGASFLAVIAGQLIHPTIGSLYFSVALAVLTALIWKFLWRSTEHD